jgi:hypothetical protein
MNSMLKIVCRASNRFFVGLPLCTLVKLGRRLSLMPIPFPTGRDPDYLDMSMTFTMDVMKTAIACNLAPKFLQP